MHDNIKKEHKIVKKHMEADPATEKNFENMKQKMKSSSVNRSGIYGVLEPGLIENIPMEIKDSSGITRKVNVQEIIDID